MNYYRHHTLDFVCLTVCIAICAMFCSCTSKGNEYAGIVTEWQGKEIVLPGGMTDLLTGDTIDSSEADFTILTYVDSAGCTSCKLKLPMWKEFIGAIDTISEYDITTIMVVHTTDAQEVKDFLKRDVYNYPVYADTADIVNALNAFPTDSRCHTFLLDKSHRVLAIGNPTYSTGVATLFKSILSGNRTLDPSFKQDIVVADNHVELHKLAPGDTALYETRLINNGPDTVYIDKILNSCDCMVSAVEKNFITPNGSLDISIKLTTDSTYGEFYRSTHIYYNGFDYPSVINFHGYISDVTNTSYSYHSN